MNKKILTITLNPAVDKFAGPSSGESVSAGGKGINVSRALHALGMKSLATGILGGASGGLIKEHLEEEGITFDFLWIDKESRTNITFRTAAGGDPKRLVGKGPRVDKKTLVAFEKKLKRLLRGSAYVVLCGKNAQGAPHDYYAKLIRLIKASHVPTALDTSAMELSRGLPAMPDIIKPNLQEAQAVLGRKLGSIEKLKGAVKEFHRRGIRTVLITMAESGAVGGHDGRIWHCRVPKFRGGHGVGCGDSFLAGFLSAHLRGFNFPDALRFAASCATINYRAQIPGALQRPKVEALFKTIKASEV